MPELARFITMVTYSVATYPIVVISSSSDCSRLATCNKETFSAPTILGITIGQSEVPDARPSPENRLFTSDTVEAVILDVGSRIKDDTIRTIFANCLPSTLGKTQHFFRNRSPLECPIAPFSLINRSQASDYRIIVSSKSFIVCANLH